MKCGMVIPTLGPLAAGAGAREAQITIAQRAEAERATLMGGSLAKMYHWSPNSGR